MTEAEWLTCDKPLSMFRFLGAGVILLSKWAPPEMEARSKRSPRLVVATDSDTALT